MSGVEIRQRAASEGQMGGRRGQEGRPAPLYRASWSTALYPIYFSDTSCKCDDTNCASSKTGCDITRQMTGQVIKYGALQHTWTFTAEKKVYELRMNKFCMIRV